MSGVNDQNKLEFLENPAPNEITYDNTTNSIDIKTFNRYFRFNSSNSKGHRFRYYDGAKQKDIQLYKLVSSGETTITNYQFSDISLRFGILFSKAEYDKMIVEGATFGVELTNKKDSKTINVPCTPARVDQSGLESETGEFYQFAAVIEGITEAQYALEIDARCYVEINGVKHYLKKATNSVISIAKTYVTESDTSAYTQHLDALKALSNK